MNPWIVTAVVFAVLDIALVAGLIRRGRLREKSPRPRPTPPLPALRVTPERMTELRAADEVRRLEALYALPAHR